jgi:Tfp pilus assembly pilus retraction ATPase PilT
MRHLSLEPRFAALIDRVGRPRLAVQKQRGPYEALMRAIELISQRMDDINLPATHPRSQLLNKEKQKMMLYPGTT